MTDINYTHITAILDSSGSMSSIQDDTIGGFNTFLKAQKEAPGRATFTHIHFSSGIHKGKLIETPVFVNPAPMPVMPAPYPQPNWGQANVVPLTFGSISGQCVPSSVSPKTWASTGYGGAYEPYAVVDDFVAVSEVKELTRLTFVPSGMTPLLDSIARAINETGEKLAALPESLRPGKVLFVIITDGAENASKKFNRQQVFDMIKHQTEVYQWCFTYLGANQDAIAEAAKFGISAGLAISYGTNKAAMDGTYGLLASKTGTFRCATSSVAATASMNYTAAERAQAVAPDVGSPVGPAGQGGVGGFTPTP